MFLDSRSTQKRTYRSRLTILSIGIVVLLSSCSMSYRVSTTYENGQPKFTLFRKRWLGGESEAAEACVTHIRVTNLRSQEHLWAVETAREGVCFPHSIVYGQEFAEGRILTHLRPLNMNERYEVLIGMAGGVGASDFVYSPPSSR